MRLGQQLRVRKYQSGGLADHNCTTQGGTWTGSTCDMSSVAGNQLTNVSSQAGSQFDHLASFQTGEDNQQAMATYLKDTYGLQDPGDHLSAFEAYNPAKEQELQKSHQMGMNQAQTGARQQMGDMYGKARAAGAKGGGFGGRGKTLSAMKGKTLGGLETKQQQLGASYTGGVQGLREDYVGDWLGQVGKLGSMGATICKPGVQKYNESTKKCEDI